MNSLEFIDAEIIMWQERLDKLKKELIRVKGTRNEETILNHIEVNELHLQYLNQIKAELKAWYVMNEEFIIKPYYQDKENNKHPAIMVQHRVEHDFEYVRRGVKQKSFDIVQKAQEVKK